ncbi:hypothetical protein OG453_37825 [Streptomyces sp. NBC_01381]|uniref:Tc toxin subunit A-related protein n=1 Tax=Streptomyces sp. NBC_01381 TaxID=2903845 RepID=UPI00224FA221|nr:hypothetical protein [Streptomyces sp. NBC_01381]MCX4672358.1 hypothetical protein [Streptomyces sp. NBC_01381]
MSEQPVGKKVTGNKALAYEEVHYRTDLHYRFTSHTHPYAGELLRRLIEGGVDAALAADTATPPLRQEFFAAAYAPTPVVTKPYPVHELDFTGPYAGYHREFGFHLPLALGLHLSRNQRFDEARQWFSYIFDPAPDGDDGTLVPQRYWQYAEFRQTDVQSIEKILTNLASGEDKELRAQTVRAIANWRENPLQPHAIARMRPSAYMMATVFAVLDNYIAAGDYFYGQDTRESVNEATQYYILAANLLGPRPQSLPRKAPAKPQTYAQLRSGLDEFGNALRSVETDIPFAAIAPPGAGAASDQSRALSSLGTALYFGVPRDEKLLDYWDTVAARLFNIRNSLNLQGTFRQLPANAPALDPAVLVRAAAVGVDVGAVAAGTDQPLPLVRFRFLAQKATEICRQAGALSGALFAAMEKGDGEKLAALHAQHETALLELGESVRYAQLQEAKKSTESVQKSLELVAQRFAHYGSLLGLTPDKLLPPTPDALVTDSLDALQFSATEPDVEQGDLAYDIAKGAEFTDAGKRKLSTYEYGELAVLKSAQEKQTEAANAELIASLINLIPMFATDVKPFGVGAGLAFGGEYIARMLSTTAAASRAEGAHLSYRAGLKEKFAGYDRRQQDWALNRNLAAGELTQIFKQLRAAQLREYIAAREWTHHIKQKSQAREIQQFLSGETGAKAVTTAVHAYHRRETRGLLTRAIDLALEVARKAERALQHELGDPAVSFLTSDYLAGSEKLLAADRLALDIQRMETAYDDLNEREYQMVKHLSLAQTDPLALMRLRATGRCSVSLREVDFDADAPGQLFRRTSSFAVSVPGATPYGTGINLKLTLVRSAIRTSTSLDGGYARRDDDTRFSEHFGAVDAVVVCEGVRDTGQDPRDDERLKKFERSGVIGDWELELPHEIPQFDPFTLDDVLLHVVYTAREGGRPLRQGAVDHLAERLNEGTGPGSVRLFSVPAEFPGAWARFTNDDAPRPRLALPLRAEHYPYWSKGRLDRITGVHLLARTDGPLRVFASRAAGAEPDPVSVRLGPEVRTGELNHVPLPPPITPEDRDFTLYFDGNTMKDLWLAFTWAKA